MLVFKFLRCRGDSLKSGSLRVPQPPAPSRPSPVRDGDLSTPSVLPRRPLPQFQFAATPDCIHCPVPPKLTSCGFPGTLSVIFSVALRAPVAFGVKVTTTEQFNPGASVAGDNGQVVV